MNEYIFGTEVAGTQSPPARHAYLAQAMIDIAKNSDRHLKILEIGSWVGASTITIGTTLKNQFSSLSWELHVIDPWSEYFDNTINSNEHYASMNELARTGRAFQFFLHNIKNAGIDRNIVIHKGASFDILPQLPKQSFDLIYIDGNHLYEFVKSDLSYAKQLVSANGIICGDDLECPELPADKERHKKLLANSIEYCYELCYHPGVTQAVIEELGILEPMQGFWAVKNIDILQGKFHNIIYSFNPRLIPSHLPLNDESFFLDSKNGYNIILINSGIVQIDQAIGQIDLSNNIEHLLKGNDSVIKFVGSRDELLRCDLFKHSSIPSESYVELIAEGYKEFNILKVGNQFYGIPQGEGEFSLERIEKQDYSVLYVDDNEAALREQITGEYLNRKVYLIAEGYKGFNILKVRNQFYGIPQGEGEFSLERVEKQDYSVLYVDDNEVALREQITSEDFKSLNRVLSFFRDR